jgi:hypothetical protein
LKIGESSGKNQMKRYAFNIIVVGHGESVDEAFSRVLDSLREDPEAAIINEVVYVITDDEAPQDETPT